MTEERRLQQYYKCCYGYFSHLKEKEFRDWFLKYYKFLCSEKMEMVLDVGCGVGQVVTKLAEVGLESVGVDLSPIAIKLAMRGRKKNSNASFLVASCYKLPFKPEAFDVVGCFDVLEHLYDPENCVNEMLRVMKKDGAIVLAGPNLLCPVYGRNFKQRISKMKRLFSKIIGGAKTTDFNRTKPKLDWSGKEVGNDADAITIIEPMALRKLLETKKIRIVYQSSYLGSNRLVEKLSTLPVIRNIGGGIFTVGKRNGVAQSPAGNSLESPSRQHIVSTN